MVIIPIILALLIALQATQFRSARDLRQEVDASYKIHSEVELVLSLHREMELGQRGYMLTGDENYLAPYRDAQARIWPALQQLAESARGVRDYNGSMEELADLTRRKLASATRASRLIERGEFEGAARSEAIRENKAILDRVRAIIAKMDTDEHGYAQASIARADDSRENIQRLTFGLEALLALLLAAATWIVGRSMTATRNAVKRLRDLSARQEAIFDAATEGMVILDPKGFIESLNPAAAQMYGYDAETLVGRSIGILFAHPPTQEELELFLSRRALDPKGQGRTIQEFLCRRQDGSIFPADVSTSPVPLTDGLHFVAIIRDATERKRIEQMKTEFVSTVSHELRTPLTSIAGSLGLLSGGAAGELPERASKLIKIARSNSERLVRLINDILDVEKIESGKMIFDVRPVPLRPLIEQTIQANQAYAEEYGVGLRLAEGGDDATALADSDRLMQVLTNLISNAAKFSPRGEFVTVTITPGKESHRVTVTDKGAGIPAEFQERIFSKFAQADASDTRQKGGTGLGLSIVKEIVTKLGGSISFETGPGQGTSFHMELPAASAILPVDAAKPRILVCQDDARNAGEVERTLSHAGFDCDMAKNSEQARRLAGQSDYAAVLLDLTLPGEETIGLIRHLRSDSRYARTPILVATSEGASGDVSQALEIVDWLQKPVPIDQLVERVEEATLHGRPPSILHVEDDPDIQRVVAGAFESRAELTSVADLQSARDALQAKQYDLVILDLTLPSGSGLELLSQMQRGDGTPIPVVIFSAQDEDPELAKRVEAMLTKSRASLSDLVATVQSLIARSRSIPSEKSR